MRAVRVVRVVAVWPVIVRTMWVVRMMVMWPVRVVRMVIMRPVIMRPMWVVAVIKDTAESTTRDNET